MCVYVCVCDAGCQLGSLSLDCDCCCLFSFFFLTCTVLVKMPPSPPPPSACRSLVYIRSSRLVSISLLLLYAVQDFQRRNPFKFLLFNTYHSCREKNDRRITLLGCLKICHFTTKIFYLVCECLCVCKCVCACVCECVCKVGTEILRLIWIFLTFILVLISLLIRWKIKTKELANRPLR